MFFLVSRLVVKGYNKNGKTEEIKVRSITCRRLDFIKISYPITHSTRQHGKAVEPNAFALHLAHVKIVMSLHYKGRK
jgi:hypothetical protein